MGMNFDRDQCSVHAITQRSRTGLSLEGASRGDDINDGMLCIGQRNDRGYIDSALMSELHRRPIDFPCAF